MSSVTERLKIENFLSIKHFDWEIKDFNVLTGGMASGKSLCMKLLHFIEQILHRNIYFARITRDALTKENFYSNISKQFDSVFHSRNQQADFCNTKIAYTFAVSEKNMVFDLHANWNKDTQKLEWRSDYIDARIDTWRDFLGEQNTPDAAKNARLQIHENIAHDFSNNFPIAAMFIPASRAIAAITSNTSDIPDSYLSSFINDDKSFVMEFNDVSENDTNKILHVKGIFINQDSEKQEKTISFELADGRKIMPLELSSGQQELLFLLLLIKDLPRTEFFYEGSTSIFIEEPSAHLFPQEQKESVEYFAKIFRKLKDRRKKKVRFFITTHSPYILNVINNMLKKGSLINKNQDQAAKINTAIVFPHLFMQELSATFINADGTVTDMLDYEEEIMFADKIAAISYSINEDTAALDNLSDELMKAGE
jgi:ABC-type lipoprotein export system ATPase subunit